MSLSNKQNGAVSLFIVVITALLITVITVSFVGIMVKNQQQASVIDLSQSAYDSAQAGVEDAKRALLKYQSICDNGGDCNTARTQLNSSTCNTAVESLVDVAGSKVGDEIKVQTGSANSLDQAYTCVKISLETDDYVGVLTKDDSKVIPLVGSDTFDTVNIEWFSTKDLQGSSMTVDVPNWVNGSPLLKQDSWTSGTSLNRPAILRTQLIEFTNSVSGFLLSDFNGENENGSNNTLFLYPSTIPATSASTKKDFSFDDKRLSSKNLTQVPCEKSLMLNNYSCSVEIKLPKSITAGNHTAYLNLTAIYKNTHYRITLKDSANSNGQVKFDSVQPKIDSTGRTNDLFRRVEARVELNDINFPYPTAAVYTQGDFCKDFLITDNIDDYHSNCTY